MNPLARVLSQFLSLGYSPCFGIYFQVVVGFDVFSSKCTGMAGVATKNVPLWDFCHSYCTCGTLHMGFVSIFVFFSIWSTWDYHNISFQVTARSVACSGYGYSTSLGEMVTSWESSSKTSSGWSQLAMNTHLYLPKWPVILTFCWRRLPCAAHVLTSYRDAFSKFGSPCTITSHIDGFQHCTPCCCFLSLNLALQVLTH